MPQTPFNHKKYTAGERISFHQNREVFRAQNTSGEHVILKQMYMGRLSDWKPLELFEREAKTLQTLKHNRIPKLLDFFHEEIAGQISLTMVMEAIKGPNLTERMLAGWRPKEAEVIEIARQGFEILKYLHSHEPPVIHRDIKPSNLIWTDQNELFLIDFGAVRDIFIAKGSSTVIGTFGYMAPEQFTGQTVPASDLYSLGATLLHLLAGRPPSDMQQKHLMPDFRPYVSCSLELQRFIEELLVPDLEERLPNADKALEVIHAFTHQREYSPSRRMLYSRNQDDISIELLQSVHPVKLCLEHPQILSQIFALFCINSLFLYYIFWFSTVEHFHKYYNFWNTFTWNYAYISNLLLFIIFFQFIKTAKESFKIKFLPDQLHIQLAKDNAPYLIQRDSIEKITRQLNNLHTKVSRLGVSIKLKPIYLDNSTEKLEFLDISVGLSNKDQHWLMTKLLQYIHQADLPEMVEMK